MTCLRTDNFIICRLACKRASSAYLASSFFLSVAYYWIVYYLVGYAVCLRRIYETGPGRVLGRVVPAEALEERPVARMKNRKI